MISFELYLIEQGYSVYHSKFKNGKWNKTNGYEQISTMVNLDNRYEKGEITFIIGLHEKDKPITLISPRPIIETKIGEIYSYYVSDDIMNRILKEKTNEELYNIIINKEIIKL